MDKKRAERSPETAALVKKYRKQIAVTLILCLISIGVIAGATAAWYANNKKVSASDANITSETPTASLYIAKGNTNDKAYYTSVNASASDPANKGLYPISTVDCKNWYYVSGWKAVDKGDNSGSLIPMASSYTLVNNPTAEGMVVTYTDAVTNKEHVAYYKQPFTIYTDRDSLDVYLAGLDVSAQGDAAKLQSGLRIAITNETGELLLYYAPNSESGTGNSLHALTGKYTGIKGTGEADIQEIPTTLSDLSGILATPVAGSTTEYNVAGLTSFGAANTTGLVLNTYVWLEGTDAQTLGHITGGITEPLSVTFTFVGVEKATA